MIREIKKEITARLRTLTPNVYYDTGDETKGFPYIVFDTTSLIYSEGLFRGNLDIDIWDRNTSYATVDELSEKVIDLLNDKNFVGETMGATLLLANVLDVDDEDLTRKRKTVIFEIQVRRK